jgi:hypothetical protein
VDDNHPPTDWVTTFADEKVQTDYVEQFYTVLFSHPAMRAITWWDLSDRNAWRNAPAGLVRKDMSPKPAYQRLLSLIHGKWWTNTAGTTDMTGKFNSSVFRGTFRISVETANGRHVEPAVSVRGSAQVVSVRL